MPDTPRPTPTTPTSPTIRRPDLRRADGDARAEPATKRLTLKKVSRVPSIGRVRPNLKLSSGFVRAVRPELHAFDVRLNGNRVVHAKALRNPGEGGTAVGRVDSQQRDGNWACTTESWSADLQSPENFIIMSNTASLYPGAVLDYAKLAAGDLQPMPYARKPITLSASSPHFDLAAIAVKDPTRGNVRQALSDLTGSQRGPGSSYTQGVRTQVRSEEELFLATHGGGYFLGFGGSHEVSFGSREKSFRYLVEAVQLYYEIEVDLPAGPLRPDTFFVTTTERPGDPAAVASTAVDPNWVYVERVSYGRILTLLLESDESLETVGLDVDAYATVAFAGGWGGFSASQQALLARSSVTVLAIGGEPGRAGQLLTATPQTIKEKVDAYFAGTDDEVPIAYSLRTLDGAPVGLRFVTDFTARQCAPVAERYRVTWQAAEARQVDDGGMTEQCQLRVRIRAWEGDGDDVMDEGKKNRGLLDAVELRKQGLNAGLPWTFTRGSEEQPIHLTAMQKRDMSTHHVTFKLPANDPRARIGIRADVIEYDDFSNDDFTDDTVELTLAEIGAGKSVRLVCTHDASRIDFTFRIEPQID